MSEVKVHQQYLPSDFYINISRYVLIQDDKTKLFHCPSWRAQLIWLEENVCWLNPPGWEKNLPHWGKDQSERILAQLASGWDSWFICNVKTPFVLRFLRLGYVFVYMGKRFDPAGSLQTHPPTLLETLRTSVIL